jgi:Protein kinase domain
MGVSKVVKNAIAAQNTRVGTPLYLSPELVKQKPYDYKIDVWAMGCILYQMCNGKAPFAGENLISLGYSIVHNQPTPIASSFSSELAEFIMKLLEKSPTRRPSTAEASALIQQYRRQIKGADTAPKSQTTLRLAAHDPETKTKIMNTGPGFKLLSEDKNPEGEPIDNKDLPVKRIEEEKILKSPRKMRLVKAMGKTDSKNVGIMSSQFKKGYPQSTYEDKESEPQSIMKLDNGVFDSKEPERKQQKHVNPVQDSVIDHKMRESQISKPQFATKIDGKPYSQSTARIETPTNEANDIYVPSIDRYSSGHGHLKTQEAKEVVSEVKKQNHSVAHIKPKRNIHSAYIGKESRPSTAKLVVNPRKLQNRVKCVEMMLKRAIMKDPIHNMLKRGVADGLQGTSPYSPPTNIKRENKSEMFGPAYYDKEHATEAKPEKITIGSMPTSAMEYQEKPKNSIYDGPPMRSDIQISSLVSHPFLDPFKKFANTPVASRADVQFSKRSEEELQNAHSLPKRENFRAKVRPQTANPHSSMRPASGYSGVSNAQPGPARSRDLDISISATDKRNYRIKTANQGAKKDQTVNSLKGPKSIAEFKERKITVHDL